MTRLVCVNGHVTPDNEYPSRVSGWIIIDSDLADALAAIDRRRMGQAGLLSSSGTLAEEQLTFEAGSDGIEASMSVVGTNSESRHPADESLADMVFDELTRRSRGYFRCVVCGAVQIQSDPGDAAYVGFMPVVRPPELS